MKLGSVLGDAWRLFSPYFLHSKERVGALLILALLLALNLAQVGIGVLFTFWTAQEYNALQALDAHAFWQLIFTYRYANGVLMPGFPFFAIALTGMGIYTVWVQQLLQIKWRAWLTDELTRDWLSHRAYYQIGLSTDPQSTGTDNPDQRIADDLNTFTDNTLTLGTDFVSNVVSLFSYVFLLYTLGGSLTLFGVTIPGYMLWVAILYALVSTLVTHLVGRPLVPLRFQQQRLEANFRFNLVRVRENVEGIALSGGETQERAGLGSRFDLVVANSASRLSASARFRRSSPPSWRRRGCSPAPSSSAPGTRSARCSARSKARCPGSSTNTARWRSGAPSSAASAPSSARSRRPAPTGLPACATSGRTVPAWRSPT